MEANGGPHLAAAEEVSMKMNDKDAREELQTEVKEINAEAEIVHKDEGKTEAGKKDNKDNPKSKEDDGDRGAEENEYDDGETKSDNFGRGMNANSDEEERERSKEEIDRKEVRGKEGKDRFLLMLLKLSVVLKLSMLLKLSIFVFSIHLTGYRKYKVCQ